MRRDLQLLLSLSCAVAASIPCPVLFADNPAKPASPTAIGQVDVKMASKLQAIMAARQKQDNGDYQSKDLDHANDAFLSYMEDVCKNPALMNQSLKKACNAGLSIAASGDKNLRIYGWDTDTGGTMHFVSAIVQYKAGPDNKTNALVLYPSGKPKESDGDVEAGYTFYSIYQMRTNDGKTIYLPIGAATYSGMDSGQVIQAFMIESGKLKKVAIFKTKTKLLDEISCNFHGGNTDDISLDEKSKKLCIPLLKDEGVPTGKYLVYVFDGHHFIYKDIEPGHAKKQS